MSFLAPSLLFGLILASAPIIIHLLNRRRFVRIDWAPMKYLKLTLKSNRRRLRLEQWLLLAIRTLAVIMLFLAVARPMGSGTNLAGFLQVQGRASRILVIDDSLSMGYLSAGETAFQRAQRAAVSILERIGLQDSITVVTTSRPNVPLVRHSQLDEISDLAAAINTLEPTDVASAWNSTLEAVDAHLQTATFPIREVILLTDLKAAGWTSEATPLCDRWAEEEVTLRIIDVGVDPLGNRVLEAFVQSDPIALLDSELTLTAQVRSDGADPLLAEQGLLTIDDAVQPITLPDIPANETVEVPVRVTFDKPGQHLVTLSLPSDALPADNVRHLMVDVRRYVDVTLVDGEPGLNPFESETDFIALALAAGNSRWRTTQSLAGEWKARTLTPADVLVLANVDAIPKERVAELEQLVEHGLGVVVFAGDQLDTYAWNNTLYRDGAGIAPARINGFQDAAVTGLALEPVADSPLAALTEISPENLARIRPSRFLDVSLPADHGESVRVLARWNDPQQSPAVVEKRFGQGRVLLFTVTADRAWSDWPTEASYVLAVRMVAEAVAARYASRENIVAGQPLRYPLDPDFLPSTASVLAPGSEAAEPLIIDKSQPAAPQLVSEPALRAGRYVAKWNEPGLGARTRQFACSADVADSRLERLTDAALEQVLGRLEPKMIRFSDDAIDVATEGAELWRTFVMVLIGLALVESLLAPWVGRAR